MSFWVFFMRLLAVAAMVIGGIALFQSVRTAGLALFYPLLFWLVPMVDFDMLADAVPSAVAGLALMAVGLVLLVSATLLDQRRRPGAKQ
ncbi:hypothetical protein ACERK3_12190 [Phycisphaerales bacterium AB-hyl4]|uniref:Uncharacterized protein n=1 Tax=Natronomicrosphaera hydrolytica TaxID=3242702 RepID=A0ABV4U7S8_9BACT